MIKVGLVTTWEEPCGHFCYASELVEHVSICDVQFVIIGRPFTPQTIIGKALEAQCDIVHINHANQLFGDLNASHIKHLRSLGIKTVATWHESTTENRSELTVAFDRVVVHQATSDGFARINDGIWNFPASGQTYTDFVGIVGFPFAYKNVEITAEAVAHAGLRLKAFLPASHHVDVDPIMRAVIAKCPGSVVYTGWNEQKQIIREFQSCMMTLFPYAHCGTGIGGSVRLGIAARRPVIISKVVRFQDLLDGYRDEFYVIDNPYPRTNEIYNAVQAVKADLLLGYAKVPSRCIADMDWKKSAAAYVQIYQELMNGKA